MASTPSTRRQLDGVRCGSYTTRFSHQGRVVAEKGAPDSLFDLRTGHMFQGASAFIQPLGSWKLRPGCQTASMFAATNFNNSRPVESAEAPAPAPGTAVPEAQVAVSALPDPTGAADAVEAEVAVAHAQIAEARRTGAIDEEAAAVAWAAA